MQLFGQSLLFSGSLAALRRMPGLSLHPPSFLTCAGCCFWAAWATLAAQVATAAVAGTAAVATGAALVATAAPGAWTREFPPISLENIGSICS